MYPITFSSLLTILCFSFSFQAFSEEEKPKVNCYAHCSDGDHFVPTARLQSIRRGEDDYCVYKVEVDSRDCAGSADRFKKLEEYERREELRREYEYKLSNPKPEPSSKNPQNDG